MAPIDVFDLFAKISLDTSEYESGLEGASGKTSSFATTIKNGLATAAKIGAAAIATTTAAVGALTSAAIENYAEYEQLVGGVETLFGTSADKVQEYADKAYQTAGLSANAYMETVTSFSASLLQSLDGDTAAAAEYANVAITDMSDNANKMGSSMEAIQNAYQGFAKQNYTMLDNLKLGYGGTQTEMERLLQDADALSDSFNLATDANGDLVYSYADIVDAIHIVQTEMGITGTTAKEASTTIQGSVASTKAAWENLLTSLASGKNVEGNIQNLVSAVETAAGNIIPVIESTLQNIGSLVEQLSPVIAEKLPAMIEATIPSLLSAGTALLEGLIQGVVSALPNLVSTGIDLIIQLGESILSSLPLLGEAALQIISTLSTQLTDALPQLLEMGIQLIGQLIAGIGEALPQIADAAVGLIGQLVSTLTNPTTLMGIVDSGLQLIVSLVNGLVSAIPELLRQVPILIGNLVATINLELPNIISTGIDLLFALISGVLQALPELAATAPNLILTLANGILNNLDRILLAGPQIILSLCKGLIGAIPDLIATVPRLISSVVKTFTSYNWKDIGSNIVSGIKNGLLNSWNSLVSWVSSKVSGLVSSVKSLLGIHSPSTVFAGIGENMALGLGEGWGDEYKSVQSDILDGMDFSSNVAYEVKSVSAGNVGVDGTLTGSTINININGANYSDETSLAQAISYELQKIMNGEAAVFA